MLSATHAHCASETSSSRARRISATSPSARLAKDERTFPSASSNRPAPLRAASVCVRTTPMASRTDVHVDRAIEQSHSAVHPAGDEPPWARR
eukprot:scaffold222107_cov27-Tisochrysis_lutea.AAC.2